MKKDIAAFVLFWMFLGACVTVVVSPTSCTTSQQRVTYNTLYTLEKSTLATYDEYLNLVIAGKLKTNSLPAISQAFNDFQVSMQASIAIARFSTNAPATPETLAKAAAVTTAISKAKGGL